MNNPCSVCHSDSAKYKCPKCYAYYCSVECCRNHKKSFCEKPPTESEPNAKASNPELTFDADEEGNDYVPRRLLENLSSSEKLRELLANRHLRNYLSRLDSSKRPDVMFEEAMREPIFVEFADECLRCIDRQDVTSSSQ